MAIQLTPAAIERVRQFLSREPDAIGLRFGVKKTGCSGWGYTVEVAREQRPGDSVIEQEGVRVLVDSESLTLVDGTEIDFVRQGLNQQFAFRNPQAVNSCGCGESFSVAAAKG